ncbi:MAG: hypothetical protein KY445_16325 [Armatimonadetes bacterium]|nr:hypothetical protein [Armatimonadota bacterium]
MFDTLIFVALVIILCAAVIAALLQYDRANRQHALLNDALDREADLMGDNAEKSLVIYRLKKQITEASEVARRQAQMIGDLEASRCAEKKVSCGTSIPVFRRPSYSTFEGNPSNN